MIGARRQTSGHQLLGVVRAAFGKRWLQSVQRLAEGTAKGAYRLTLDDGRTAVAYVWHEDGWPAGCGLFGRRGLDAFAAAHGALRGLGVRVPEVVMLDRSGTFVEGEVAVVEDIRGGALSGLDPTRAEQVLHRLGHTIRQMHSCGADRYGPPGDEAPPDARPAEHIVLDRALADVATAAGQADRIAAARDRLTEALLTRHAAVTPRTRYGLVHGALSPDHVLVDEHDEPVLIAIEGALTFDAEWEDVSLALRFGDRYRYLATPGLDEDRLRFYRLATYLSMVADPLRQLADGLADYTTTMATVSANVERTLGELSSLD
jgi:hypothetical protein